jgi:hypothetical protein
MAIYNLMSWILLWDTGDINTDVKLNFRVFIAVELLSTVSNLYYTSGTYTIAPNTTSSGIKGINTASGILVS